MRNKQKFAALYKEIFGEHPRSNLAQNSNVPKSQEEYIAQVSEPIDGIVTWSLSQEFSRTESCILAALSRLDDFLLNPLNKGHSGIAPEISQNTIRTSQGTNEDDSQSESHPEVGVSQSQSTQNSGPDDAHDSSSEKKIRRCWSTTHNRFLALM